MQHLNPRHAQAVALPKPSDVERGQWYFQRYVAHLPTRGNMVLFDRSWYNRAGVERVMGFCSEEEAALFLEEAPKFEAGLVRDGFILIKLWLSVGREMQLKRFHARRHHPLKRWKLTDIDIAGLTKWEAYNLAHRGHLRPHPHRRGALDGGAGQRQAPGAARRLARGAVTHRLHRQERARRERARPQDRGVEPEVLCYRLGPREPQAVIPATAE